MGMSDALHGKEDLEKKGTPKITVAEYQSLHIKGEPLGYVQFALNLGAELDPDVHHQQVLADKLGKRLSEAMHWNQEWKVRVVGGMLIIVAPPRDQRKSFNDSRKERMDPELVYTIITEQLREIFDIEELRDAPEFVYPPKETENNIEATIDAKREALGWKYRTFLSTFPRFWTIAKENKKIRDAVLEILEQENVVEGVNFHNDQVHVLLEWVKDNVSAQDIAKRLAELERAILETERENRLIQKYRWILFPPRQRNLANEDAHIVLNNRWRITSIPNGTEQYSIQLVLEDKDTGEPNSIQLYPNSPNESHIPGIMLTFVHTQKSALNGIRIESKGGIIVADGKTTKGIRCELAGSSKKNQ